MKKILKFAVAALIAAPLFTACDKGEEPYEPQPPVAEIENISEVTSIGQGEKLSLKANITSALDATITWSVDDVVVAEATAETFDFSTDKVGEHKISLKVENVDGEVSDDLTVSVYYLMDFEDVPAEAQAVDKAGSNLGEMSGFTDEGRGVEMPFNEDTFGLFGDEGAVMYSLGGVAISQFNDMETAGYLNQCSVYYKDATTTFGGYGGSKTFAVNYCDTMMGEPTKVVFDAATEPYYMWVTTNTYAVLSMMNGDGFAKKFAYPTEENPEGDWFKLTISAVDADGEDTGTPVEVYLADFREATSPGIMTEWTKVDLTPLGENVHTMQFKMSSTDNSYGMMNTPAYFCFDNLAFMK